MVPEVKDGEVEIEIKVVPDDFDFNSIDKSKDTSFYLKDSQYKTLEKVAEETKKPIEEVFSRMFEYLATKDLSKKSK